MLYSNKLPLFEDIEILSEELKEAIREIKQYLQVDDLKILSYDQYSIAIPITLSVSLPSRGSVNNLIKSEEPILIKFSLKDYPHKGPLVFPDRLDFPVSMLPHLYLAVKGRQPALCLIRGNYHEWFATSTIADFLLVVQQWFYKAAAGILSRDNNEFDPTLLHSIHNTHVYSYQTLHEIVSQDLRFIPQYSMSLILSYMTVKDTVGSDKYSITSLFNIPLLAINQISDIILQVNKLTQAKEAIPFFSLLVWDPDKNVEDNYATKLPKNFGELTQLLRLKGINLHSMLQIVDTYQIGSKFLINIVHAVLRPSKIIGLPGNYEFFTYMVLAPEGGISALADDNEVYMADHSEPYSESIAHMLTGEKRSNNTLFVGAGSLGSKIILHEGRSGNLNLGIVDNDTFEQHNLARHALFGSSVGQNKADAMVRELKGLYLNEVSETIHSYPIEFENVPQQVLNTYERIVDSTASNQVLRYITLLNLPNNCHYIKCEIADNGALGIMYFEGNDRNPRIDDLIAYTFYLGTKDPNIELWRKNDSLREIHTVDIGQGCSSTTTIMPDDMISLHASSFSRTLHNKIMFEQERKAGKVFLSINSERDGLISLSSRTFTVEPFTIYNCNAGSNWQTRISAGLSEKLIELCNRLSPRETGGVLIGVANYKTKVIHVVDFIEEPADSKGITIRFTRGIAQLSTTINQIKEKTGNVIGYIGEWHTHPMNLETLSNQDMISIDKLKQINSQIPIPTCAIIVTPNKILPFIFI
jgi:hypothetical protein